MLGFPALGSLGACTAGISPRGGKVGVAGWGSSVAASSGSVTSCVSAKLPP